MLGINALCFVFCKGLSRIRIRAGRTVTQPMTPIAMTMPKSRPMVKDMEIREINPATVVMELPTTLVSVFWIATAMASL